MKESLIRQGTWLPLVLALVVGLLAGLAGGVFGARLSDSDTSAPGAVSTATPDLQARIRAAVDRVLPNVVLILADLPAGQDAQGRTIERQNIGSGVVVSQEGHILTNSHVVSGASSISVFLPTGEQRPARLLADDAPFTDSAMLQVDARGLRQIAFGASGALQPGETVVAVTGGGGIFGPGNAVTTGVVSAISRILPRSGVTFEDLIQTDAVVNSGDSGGALVNLNGEFVGLITTVVRDTGSGVAAEGLAFAQSSDSLRPIVADIVRTGGHYRPRIGIEFPDRQHIEVSPELAAERGLSVQEGALIVDVPSDTPAAAAGLQPGDIVVGVNGAAISSQQPMVNLLKLLPRGARVDLVLLRGGRQVSVSMTPSEG
ncbi:MAG: trypsin-like peptidase domain-containing protein [Dehalococcoidia bacterium]